MRIDAQPAYVLHTRDFRDSSLLIELLTRDHGRVSAVVKGVRSTAKSAKQRRSLMQPFVLLQVGWSGKTDLKSLVHFESNSPPHELQGKQLFSAIYVNELLTRLLHHYESNPALFERYQRLLIDLTEQALPLDVLLRRFELWLLEDLGYGIDFGSEYETGDPINASQQYHFDVEHGFIAAADFVHPHSKQALFNGNDLLAIEQGEFTDSARRCAKMICRQALAIHLGGKPLKSRELFV